MKILIDNGHGRETPGKRSPDGTLREYAWNRLIAWQLVSRLVAQGLDAQLLVPEDEDIPLKERCRRINTICRQLGKENVILISIHANAAGRGDRWYDATGWAPTPAGATPRPMYKPRACMMQHGNIFRTSGFARTISMVIQIWKRTSTFSVIHSPQVFS